MSILVAGATGLVGSAIVRELNATGKPNVGISSKDVNLLDRAATFKFVKDFKPSVVIDAAARVGGIGANNAHPVDFLTQNIQIQSNLMDAAHDAGVKNFVFLGSSCIYPKNSTQPIKEDYIMTGELESTNSAYAIAKIAGLELIKSYRKQFGHKWISIMPTNLYGPNDNFDLQNSHVFPALIRKFVEAKETNAPSVTLWGTGTPKREFLHVDDLAKAILICLENYDSDQHINIGSGEDLSIKELALKVSKATGFSGEIIWDSTKPDGTPRKVLDVTKIKNLGWKPSISLDEGIIQTIQWYRENK
jgi:GDP-L-fucose synthase